MRISIVIFLCFIQTLFSQTWQSIGPNQGLNQKGDSLHTMGYVSGIWRNTANKNEILLSTNSSGIWKTRNGGATWQSVTDKQSFIPGMGCQSFCENPKKNGELLVGAANYVYGDDNYMGRVLISKDYGDSWSIWEDFGNPTDDEIIKIAYLNEQEILIATKTVIYYTPNHGKDWETIFQLKKDFPYVQHEFQFLDDFVIFDDDHIILTSCHRFGNTGQVWRTTNKGKSWEDLTPQVAEGLGFVYAARLSDIYRNEAVLGITDGQKIKVYTISEKGASFSLLDELKTNYKTGDAKASKFEIEYSKLNPKKIYFGFVEFFEWTKQTGLVMLSNSGTISKEEHDDVRFMEVYIEDDKEYVLMGNDGGVSLYDPQKESFKSLNGANLSTVQVYKLGASQQEDYELIIGTQDNGTFMYNHSEKQWTWIDGGDGGPSWLSENSEKYLYAINGSVRYKEKENRMKHQYFSPAQRNSGWFLDFPVEVGTEEERIIIGSSKAGNSKGATLYIENVNDRSKRIATEIDRLGAVGDIAVTSTDNQLILVAANDFTDQNSGVPKLLKSTDGGVSFTDLSNSLVLGIRDTFKLKEVLNYRTVADIEVDPHDKEKLYIALTGYNKKKNNLPAFFYYRVLESWDGGETWEDMSEGLPTNYPVYKVIRHEGAEQLIFCGTDEGIYYKSKEQRTWKRFGENFPHNTTVTDLKINYVTQEIFASTFGRGVWKTQIPLFRSYEETVKDTLSDQMRVVKSDLKVKSNETLIIKNNLVLANNVSIVLAPKSKLVIDGAIIQKGNKSDLTPAVIIEEKKFLFFFKRKKGEIEYKNNGKIKQ